MDAKEGSSGGEGGRRRELQKYRGYDNKDGKEERGEYEVGGEGREYEIGGEGRKDLFRKSKKTPRSSIRKREGREDRIGKILGTWKEEIGGMLEEGLTENYTGSPSGCTTLT